MSRLAIVSAICYPDSKYALPGKCRGKKKDGTDAEHAKAGGEVMIYGNQVHGVFASVVLIPL